MSAIHPVQPPTGSNQLSNEAFLLAAYASMVKIRAFETLCQSLTRGDSPTIVGSVHLCAGQEAIPVGAMAALKPDDRVVATYRGHGWALESGVTTRELLAEVCHRAEGINGGRGGSAFASAPHRRFIGENSIVGAGGPIACGVALANQLKKTGRIVIVSFGDGAMSQGSLHEAFVFAASLQLPVVFVCENNGWSELTRTQDISRIDRLARRALGYGFPGVTIDGCDPVAVRDAVAEAADRARSGQGPTLIEAKTIRLWGHYNRDIQHYRPVSDRKDAEEKDPIPRLANKLTAGNVVSAQAIAKIQQENDAQLNEILRSVLASPLPDAATANSHVYAEDCVDNQAESNPPSSIEMTYAQAVNQALREALESDSQTIVYGEDVGKAGGIFGVSRDLQKKFGSHRVFDTPIAESAILGSAVGAAIEGARPIVEIMWADFMLVALDPIINQAANVRYLSQGRSGSPIVVRTQQGATPGSCAQHSQSLEALLAHIPGLRIGVPSTPQDAYSMLRAATRGSDPCVLFEARSLYATSATINVGGPVEPAQGSKWRRDGADVCIVGWGQILRQAVEAAEQLEKSGISVGVLDLRWLSPLDDSELAKVAERFGRIVVLHEANTTGGFGAEVAARLTERHWDKLKGPVLRVATPDARMPASPVLQKALLPTVESVMAAVKNLMRHQ